MGAGNLLFSRSYLLEPQGSVDEFIGEFKELRDIFLISFGQSGNVMF